MERTQNHRSGVLSRPYSYAVRNSTENERSGSGGLFEGESSLMIYEQFGNLKFKYRNRQFWCRGYYIDTVGKNKQKIANYIRQQLEEDKLGDQLSLPYGEDPFTGCR